MTELEERNQLARIDLALADIALKQEQLRQIPVDIEMKQEQLRRLPADYAEQLARIDLAHAEIVLKQELLSQMKTFPLGKLQGWQLLASGMTAGAAFITAGGGAVFAALHWMGKI